MDDSEEQFQDLLAHLSVRVNRMLAAGEQLPLALLLRADGAVEVAVGVAGTSQELGDVLTAMQDALKAQVADESIVASCIAYPNHEDPSFVAWLENRENYCVKVVHPILPGPSPALDIGNLRVEDGEILVFPYLEEDA